MSAYFESSGSRRGYTADADLLIRRKYEEEEERMTAEKEYSTQKQQTIEKRRLMVQTVSAFQDK